MKTIIISSVFLSSCATLFTGTTDIVGFNSEPQNAKVYLNSNYIGNTPVSMSLKRNQDYNIMFKKDNYTVANSFITRSFNPVSILNMLNIFYWAIDIVTGAVWKFDQDSVSVILDPVQPLVPR